MKKVRKVKPHPLEVAYEEGNWERLGWLLWNTFITEPHDSVVRMLADFIYEALTRREPQLVEG